MGRQVKYMTADNTASGKPIIPIFGLSSCEHSGISLLSVSVFASILLPPSSTTKCTTYVSQTWNQMAHNQCNMCKTKHRDLLQKYGCHRKTPPPWILRLALTLSLTLPIMLSATVSSANWKIGDQNYYRQFGELSWKNQKLLKAVQRFEVWLIGY